ncbi:MAG: N,N-dimethylformamidase beta subunit family domain-containing protein, partial [Alphaproteobacteria bacterium]
MPARRPGKTLLVYPDRVSAAPGETVRFMASAEDGRPFDHEILRIRSGDATPGGAGYKVAAIAGTGGRITDARRQPIHAGSYAIVPPTPVIDELASFTAQAMVMPTLPGKPWQTVMGKWAEPSECGFVVYIDDKGQFCAGIGDGRGGTCFVRSGVAVHAGRWYLVAATFDAASGTLSLWQEPQDAYPGHDAVQAAATTPVRIGRRADLPFLIAAWTEDGRADGGRVGAHFNGRIDDPVLCRRALDRAGILALRHGPVPPAIAPDVVATWDFARDMGSERIRDASPNRLDGRLVNLPTRAVRDSLWSGGVHDWKVAPGEYGAIHFHDDDLYDAGWSPSHTLTIPADARSGVYALRLEADGGPEFGAVFDVRPPRQGARPRAARVAFLASTATYLAYS